tara:strand:+ start:1021 stop:1659 length:639 start_codon:yes stop_codon:yes gene_type:complete
MITTQENNFMNPLKSVRATITLGFVLAVILAFYINNDGAVLETMNERWSLVVWLHVFFGIIWIGLLYYFNFVQVPAVGEALADEGGPGPAAINKYVAPRALWWFRWGALLTWITGAIALHYYLPLSLHDAFMLNGGVMGVTIGVGAWLGTIMLFNVWVLIWPNQKKILGIIEASADEIARAKNTALMASRTNTLLSIPMLMCMVGYGHGLPI